MSASISGSQPRINSVSSIQEGKSALRIAEEIEQVLRQARQWHAEAQAEATRNQELTELARKQEAELKQLRVRLEEALTRARTFEEQSQRFLLNERGLKDQMTETARERQYLREDIERAKIQVRDSQRKLEIEAELHQATQASLREREGYLRREAEALAQAKAQLADRLRVAEEQLYRYRSAVGSLQQEAQRAKSLSIEQESLQQEIARRRETEQSVTRRMEDMQGQAKKDRRDKEIALNCLKQAEERILELSREVESLRSVIAVRSAAVAGHGGMGPGQGSGIELKF